MTLAIKPVYERGHLCGVCGRVTTHYYLGPQREEGGHGSQEDREGKIAFHLWNCSECETTVVLDAPEKVDRRCFHRETRRMRQRRVARRYG